MSKGRGDVSLHVLKHVQRHLAADFLWAQDVKRPCLEFSSAESGSETLVMILHSAGAADLDTLRAIAYTRTYNIHRHVITELTSVHPKAYLSHQSLETDRHPPASVTAITLSTAIDVPFANRKVIQFSIHRNTFAVLVGVGHVVGDLLQLFQTVCIYVIAEIGACPDAICIAFDEAYGCLASGFRQPDAFLGVAVGIEYQKAHIADECLIRIVSLAEHLSSIECDGHFLPVQCRNRQRDRYATVC